MRLDTPAAQPKGRVTIGQVAHIGDATAGGGRAAERKSEVEPGVAIGGAGWRKGQRGGHRYGWIETLNLYAVVCIDTRTAPRAKRESAALHERRSHVLEQNVVFVKLVQELVLLQPLVQTWEYGSFR